MLDHMQDAWKAQVCRQMRLRTSIKGLGGWRYQLVVLKPVPQPHAAQDCSSACGGQSGWCDFCGGDFVGACCRKGDGGVCKDFDTPVGWYGGAYQACVHTDCIQSNTGYYGKEIFKFTSWRDNGGEPYEAEMCQSACKGAEASITTDGEDLGKVTRAVAFTLKEEGSECSCVA